MRISCYSIIVAVCLSISGPLWAGDFNFDLTAGVSTTSSGRTTAAVFGSAYGAPPVDKHVHLTPILTIGWLGGRHTHKDHLNHDSFLAAGGVRITSATGHWVVSEQLATTSHESFALSSRFQFMTSAGWQNGRFTVLLRHVSNGHILGRGKNLGETMLLAGLRFE